MGCIERALRAVPGVPRAAVDCAGGECGDAERGHKARSNHLPPLERARHGPGGRTLQLWAAPCREARSGPQLEDESSVVDTLRARSLRASRPRGFNVPSAARRRGGSSWASPMISSHHALVLVPQWSRAEQLLKPRVVAVPESDISRVDRYGRAVRGRRGARPPLHGPHRQPAAQTEPCAKRMKIGVFDCTWRCPLSAL